MVNYLSSQQKEAYEFFKNFAKKNGRLPTEKEIIKNLKLSTTSQALYWAGNILLKGGFGLKVANNPGIVEFGDFSFPMIGKEDVEQSAQIREDYVRAATPVAQAVAQAAPVAASQSVTTEDIVQAVNNAIDAVLDKYKDAPAAIRNLIQRAQVVKKEKEEKPVEIMKRDVMSVMDQLKKYNFSIPLTSRAVADALKESGKNWTPKQIGWAVHSLLKERKLKGRTGAFTYL